MRFYYFLLEKKIIIKSDKRQKPKSQKLITQNSKFKKPVYN